MNSKSLWIILGVAVFLVISVAVASALDHDLEDPYCMDFPEDPECHDGPAGDQQPPPDPDWYEEESTYWWGGGGAAGLGGGAALFIYRKEIKQILRKLFKLDKEDEGDSSD